MTKIRQSSTAVSQQWWEVTLAEQFNTVVPGSLDSCPAFRKLQVLLIDRWLENLPGGKAPARDVFIALQALRKLEMVRKFGSLDTIEGWLSVILHLADRENYAADMEPPPVDVEAAAIVREALEWAMLNPTAIPEANGAIFIPLVKDDIEPMKPVLVKPNAETPTAPQAPAIVIGAAIIKDLARFLKSKYWFARDAGEEIYVYSRVKGIYSPGDLIVRQRVKEKMEETVLLSKKWSSHRGREVVENLMLDAPELWETPPANRINVQNGIYNLDAESIDPHSPEFLSTNQIPVTHDPNATCPAWDRFVGEVFPRDAVELAWEILGDAITSDRSIQKAILLTGEGGNGKGTFLNGLIAFVGRSNLSTVSLHALEEDRFSSSRLFGKLVNVCADLPSRHLQSTSVFKSITGCDYLSGERKHEGAFDFRPYTRLLFSANNPPRSDDASKAFFDRWVVIPFDRNFRGASHERPRSELDRALAAPGELSGVFNHAIPALRRVRNAGRFSETTSTRFAMAEFQQVTDPLAVWIARHAVIHANASVPCDTLLERYNQNRAAKGEPVTTATAFGRAVRRLSPDIDTKKAGPKGAQRMHYTGIGLVADVPQPS